MNNSGIHHISRCKKLVAFYKANKQSLNRFEGIESLFVELQMQCIHLNNEHENACSHFMPFLRQKKGGLKKLELLYSKFNMALNLYLSSMHISRRRRDPELVPLTAFGAIPAEQYPGTISRLRRLYKRLLPFGIHEEDFQSFEKQVTTVILSLPMQSLFEEKVEDLHTNENSTLRDIQYLLSRQIDPHMLQVKESDPALYEAYLEACK